MRWILGWKHFLGWPNLVSDFVLLILIGRSQDDISSSTWIGSAILCDLNYEKLFDFLASTGRLIHQVPRRSDITPQ